MPSGTRLRGIFSLPARPMLRDGLSFEESAIWDFFRAGSRGRWHPLTGRLLTWVFRELVGEGFFYREEGGGRLEFRGVWGRFEYD